MSYKLPAVEVVETQLLQQQKVVQDLAWFKIQLVKMELCDTRISK